MGRKPQTTPAEAGVYLPLSRASWIPAFAGMVGRRVGRLSVAPVKTGAHETPPWIP